mmetsp:Transcript_84154/g.238803  ORF Transcript_84154/g.238803 Transcript_84154/m.238803 type:complete len:367 (+) Transcript_84154:1281-2381(+)
MMTASCLVNPLSGYETELKLEPVAPENKIKVAVVGGGCAGLAASCAAAERGHDVTLFEASQEIGGQFNFAKVVPGKEEFHETIKYFNSRLVLSGVDLKLNTTVTAEELIAGGYDRVVVATGVTPRVPNIPGIDHSKVMLYSDVLGGAPVHGKSVAVIGAGGIGFDVAEYLTHDTSHAATSLDTTAFMKEWGVDMSNTTRGGLLEPVDSLPAREVFLLQRKKGALGTGLGKTTGWIHRATLRKKAVKMLSGVEYVKVDDAGLHIKVHPKKSGPAIEQILDVDHVVVCAGQESVTGIMEPLKSAGVPAFEIGGAEHAGELDAKRAIDQGTRLAAVIETAEAGAVFNQPIPFAADFVRNARKWSGRNYS